jgi:epoxyqueuosine reductase
MRRATLTTRLKQEARRLGFDLAGACPAVEPAGLNRFGEWLAAGYAGEMTYLAKRQAAYRHPGHVLDGARSLVMLAMHYRTREPEPARPGYGRVSRYAWGVDYHELIRGRLNELVAWLAHERPGAMARGVVDTAPLLEREFAQLAGLGWIGKNTLLLNKWTGSWFFLAALLTDQELDYDDPHSADHCGTCRACLDACPTGALVAPGVLDARRCISYLTIELRTDMPAELRSGVGDWLYGCDICQEVCPWNGRAPQSSEPDFAPLPGQDAPELAPLFSLDDAEFRARFRRSPLWRAKRRGLLRNAAIVLGNQRHAAALPALIRGLDDSEPLVRAACAWAIGQMQGEDADARRVQAALRSRLEREQDPLVRDELGHALANP